MKRTSIFLYILICISIFISCSDNTLTESETYDDITQNLNLRLEKKEELKPYLDLLAKSLSIVLSDNEARTQFKNAVGSSEKTENILELTEFSNLEIDVMNENGDKVKTNYLKQMIKHVNSEQRDEFETKMKKVPFGLIDIYIPVENHRNKWIGNDDVIIASYTADMTESNFVGYKLNGDIVHLNPNTPPATPAVIITFSEKGGNYSRNSSSIINSFSLNKTDQVGGYYHHTSYINQLRINHDYDNWPLGSMEIEVHYRYNYGAGTWYSNWNVWTYYGFVPGTTWICDRTPKGDLLRDFVDIYPNSMPYQLQFEIWEIDDGGWIDPHDFVADINWHTYLRTDGQPEWVLQSYGLPLDYHWNINAGWEGNFSKVIDSYNGLDVESYEDLDRIIIEFDRDWN